MVLALFAAFEHLNQHACMHSTLLGSTGAFGGICAKVKFTRDKEV